MKKLALTLVALLLAVSMGAHAQEQKGPTEPAEAPVKVQVLGLSKDRMGIAYRITVRTHKPIRSIELGVSAYSDSGYIGAPSLRWPGPGGYQPLSWGRSYDCVLRVMRTPLPKSDTLTVDRGVLQVTFADGTRWTSAGKYGASGR